LSVMTTVFAPAQAPEMFAATIALTLVDRRDVTQLRELLADTRLRRKREPVARAHEWRPSGGKARG
jgi:hypothetical protein